jgi:hypothetical protein
MGKIFNRIIEFHVTGETYDNSKPESILRNYSWSYTNKDDGSIELIGRHQDNRGRIVNIKQLSRIHKYKKPDTKFFVNL